MSSTIPFVQATRSKKREFDSAICTELRSVQMAQDGKNRVAISTILRFCRTDVKTAF